MNKKAVTITTLSSDCQWAKQHPLCQSYHDHEWGTPQYDSQTLFEALCFESLQAGLSWLTILKKRDDFRCCFYQFQPVMMAKMPTYEVAKLMTNPHLIRHRAKLNALVNNAQAYLAMQQQGENFAHFIWSFSDIYHECVDSSRAFKQLKQQQQAHLLANQLKTRGFKFIGATSCYAFMQSVGLINDHDIYCPRYHEINKLIKAPRQVC